VGITQNLSPFFAAPSAPMLCQARGPYLTPVGDAQGRQHVRAPGRTGFLPGTNQMRRFPGVGCSCSLCPPPLRLARKPLALANNWGFMMPYPARHATFLPGMACHGSNRRQALMGPAPLFRDLQIRGLVGHVHRVCQVHGQGRCRCSQQTARGTL